VTAFFAELGLEVEGRTFVEGEFIDTVIGIPDSRTEIVMLRPPDGLAANGYGLVGGIGQHENTWRMAHVRGPEGIVVSLTERID